MNGRFKNRETFLLFDAFLSYAKRKAKKNNTKSKNDKSKRKNSGDVNCGSTIAKCILTPKSKRKQAAKNRLTHVRKACNFSASTGRPEACRLFPKKWLRTEIKMKFCKSSNFRKVLWNQLLGWPADWKFQRDSNRIRTQQLDKKKITSRKSTASVQSIAFFRQSISQYSNQL